MMITKLVLYFDYAIKLDETNPISDFAQKIATMSINVGTFDKTLNEVIA